MNTKQKCIIATMIAMVVISIWLGFQGFPTTEQEPEITYIAPTPILTPTPAMTATATPTPTATPNMTASETPTRRVTTGWYHGSGGGSSRRSSTPPAPIPELATCVLVGIGLLYLMMRRGK